MQVANKVEHQQRYVYARAAPSQRNKQVQKRNRTKRNNPTKQTPKLESCVFKKKNQNLTTTCHQNSFRKPSEANTQVRIMRSQKHTKPEIDNHVPQKSLRALRGLKGALS